MEYDYLRGAKSHFNGAPDQAMVVFENAQTGQIIFAEASTPGSKYWFSDGTPGPRIGLIGSKFHAFTLVAERRMHVGQPVGGPRPPVDSRRFDHLKSPAKKAAEASATPADKPMMPVAESTTPASWSGVDKGMIGNHDLEPLNQEDGFLDMNGFELSDHKPPRPGEHVIRFSPKLFFSVRQCMADAGDSVELQFNPNTGVVRFRKVEQGGAQVKKARIVSCAKLSRALHYPDGKSFAVTLEARDDGWLYGVIPDVNRANFHKIQRP